jgi:EAL and modified HD-GYP domain-containing signal transduction protein
MSEVFIGRQPIFDRQMNVIGYELLSRRFVADHAHILDGDQATSEVIQTTFMDIGLDRLVGRGLAFINLTRHLLLDKYPPPLPHDRVVLEVVENTRVDQELIEALLFLSGRGYRIALDDVVDPEQVRPLLDLVSIVKLDLLAIERKRLREYVEVLKEYDLKLVAEKVETQAVFEECKSLGFDYFQGYFLCKPNVVEGQSISPARLGILNLLAALQNPNLEFKDLEEIIRQDVSLSYKFMRLINSAFYSRAMKIESVRHALTMLGVQRVKAWVSLLALSKIDDKPRELVTTAIIRAKMCELLALSMEKPNPDMFFTVGMFSVLDALLDIPLNVILDSLPLSAEISEALLKRKGPAGRILECVLAYEYGDWEQVKLASLEPTVIREAYLESLNWATPSGAMVEA